MELIRHIDAICRARQAAVLYLEFHPTNGDTANWRFEHDVGRQNMLAWMDAAGFYWEPCGPIANVCRLESYRGQVWVDVDYDDGSPRYCTLRDHLEYPDGRMRDDGVRFYALTLAAAMKNSAHDAPGFWESWADNLFGPPADQDPLVTVQDAVTYMSDEQAKAEFDRISKELDQ